MTIETTSSDTLPSFCKARVLILGVGNVLFGDDGFGPAVVEKLCENYLVPEDLYIMDVGTGVRKLLFTLTLSATRPEEIIVVDAVDWGEEVGKVSEIPAEALPETKIDDFSLHQVPTSNMLRELQEHHGIKVSVVACDTGIIPQIIEPGLTPQTRQAVEVACQQLVKRFSLMRR